MSGLALPPSPEQTIHRLRQLAVEAKTKHHANPEHRLAPMGAVFVLRQPAVVVMAHPMWGRVHDALRLLGGWAGFAGVAAVGFYTDTWLVRTEPGHKLPDGFASPREAFEAGHPGSTEGMIANVLFTSGPDRVHTASMPYVDHGDRIEWGEAHQEAEGGKAGGPLWELVKRIASLRPDDYPVPDGLETVDRDRLVRDVLIAATLKAEVSILLTFATLLSDDDDASAWIDAIPGGEAS
jgi:hypothetical protein